MKICWDNLEGCYLSKYGNLIKKTDTYYFKICPRCGKEYLGRKGSKFCTNSCKMLGRTLSKKTRLAMSKSRSGSKNCNYNKKFSPKVLKNMSLAQIGKKHSEEHKEKISQAVRGENHPNWQGGFSKKDYCLSFYDEEYKQNIRDRDGNICLNCNTKHNNGTKLDVHHINYNKKDCTLKNLVTLCDSCHSRSNFNREWHTEWYRLILNKRYNYEYPLNNL